MLLTIDPGADSGWAYFTSTNRLTHCGLAGLLDRGDFLKIDTPRRVVIERPMIYPHGRQKARPEDVITLALRAGEWGGIFKDDGLTVEYVTPAEWKGQVTKDVCHARAWARLDDNERAIVDKACKGVAPSKRHNVLDAVSLGLWVVQR